jgi:hypothetical protein
VRAVEESWAAQIVTARTMLLAIPSRAKSALPHLSVSDCATLDRLIRESLIALAESGAAPLGEPANPNPSPSERREAP